MRLNFKGKVNPLPGTPMGPSLDGRKFTVAGTVYDKDTNMSEVWLDPDDG